MRQLTRSTVSGDAEICLRWEPPLDNGGDPITKYEIYRDDGMGGDFTQHVCTAGQAEVQNLGVTATSGTFTLGYNGATTSNYVQCISATVKTEIESLVINGNAIFIQVLKTEDIWFWENLGNNVLWYQW